MSRVIAAVLLGPPTAQHFWTFCRTKAEEWADDIVVEYDESGAAWGAESPFRQRLWQQAVEACEPDDWIFILDSDFVLTFDPHEFTSVAANAVRLRVYDLWSPTTYRDDVFWRAHAVPRHWMFRAGDSPAEPDWNPRGIHTGHAPSNFQTHGFCIPSHYYSILHLGWLTPEVRREKYERYKKVWDQLSDVERRHVDSILDDDPNVHNLPTEFTSCLKGL